MDRDDPLDFLSDTSESEFREILTGFKQLQDQNNDSPMDHPAELKEETTPPGHSEVEQQRSDSPVPSCLSMSSDMSMEHPPELKEGTVSPGHSEVEQQRSDSPVPSCLSMSSDMSMEHPPELKEGTVSPGHRYESAFPKEEEDISEEFKSCLKTKYRRLYEGIPKQGCPSLLSEVYTELYIIQGGDEVSHQHEIGQNETASERAVTKDTLVKYNDIFKPLSGQDKTIRIVLTTGVAGIGKTVSVQKFVQDWTEGMANQHIHFIFHFPFRELNLMKDQKYSLVELLHCYFAETKRLKSFRKEYEVLFIFDGLDECQLPLDFQNNFRVSDVTKPTSVDVLLTNLISGNLLPSALIWITSRPAAASQIPPKYIDQITEIRGFNDSQKETYFRKRIGNEDLASRIISHLKFSRSLYIMCHIPFFCWISATVLEQMFAEEGEGEVPKTLTEMYTHFLLTQTNVREEKYGERTEPNKDFIFRLGRLAFQQLVNGNQIFYEEDLRECGIDVRQASVYSGLCTQLFREVIGLQQKKVFSFVHLSIQEHLAALYAHMSFVNNNTNVLHQVTKLESPIKGTAMVELHKSAVDRALQSKNGHLDLFLRFLLGLSLESSQTLLQSLLRQTGSSSLSKEKTIKYIKKRIEETSCPEKCINLFHCLNELNDHTLVEEIKCFMSTGYLAKNLSVSQWSAVAFVLLTSEVELGMFDLKKYTDSVSDASYVTLLLLRLLPVVRASSAAKLRYCSITKEGYEALASVLNSTFSNLRELDLGDNEYLLDSGIKSLYAGLESPHCKLEKLMLNNCHLTEKSCSALSAVLGLDSSCLTELDLSENNLLDPGVTLICAGLRSPQCKLKILRLRCCNMTEKSCEALASSFCSDYTCLKELNLNDNNLLDSGVKLLSAGLENHRCKLEKLKLRNSGLTVKGCETLAIVLNSACSQLKELDLSGNDLQDSGVEELSAGLASPHCKLETLRLRSCNFTERSCTHLVSALTSFSSRLKELNLSGNELRDPGVRTLCAGLESPHCHLKTLGLENCGITEEGCIALATALRSNPSHLRELTLKEKHLGYLGKKNLSALLEDPNNKLEKLRFD
ncbi:NACHT, LRR and PYD domains-containing protein 3-like [Chanos chanos]|uniref:NACHT, LRR and PYD domains-containing protein 3-like n=1 Tax=Chanos chanos TaxID=29144 RepID=A0A6J2USP7_CHACN|nr:NACHT, LRR and PYD domains-containing protein 3-like [Chanos chanos]